MYKKPRTSLDIIEQNNWGKGIICLTACQVGRLSTLLVAGEKEQAKVAYKRFEAIFDSVFVEIQSHNTPSQAEANAAIAEFINQYQLPYVITTDAHMLSAKDHDAHSIFVKIGEGREPGESYTDCYLQTAKDVYRILESQFPHDFIQQGIANTMLELLCL